LTKYRWPLLAAAIVSGLLLLSAFLLRTTDDAAWARIQDRRTITFATDPTYPPFEALDGDGNFWGFDIDLARALAARLSLTAEFEAVSYDGLIGTLVTQRDDAVISAWQLQPERGREAGFTGSYFNAGVLLVTKAETPVEPDEILRYTWQAGKTLAAEHGSNGDALIRKWARLAAGLTPMPVPDPQAALQGVVDGRADGALVDAVAAYEFLKTHPGLRLTPIADPQAAAPYVIAVSARSPILLRELSRALDQMEADGQLGDLRVKWFGEAARGQ
jgi:ABC-type amino acid transport substrate-binding protein